MSPDHVLKITFILQRDLDHKGPLFEFLFPYIFGLNQGRGSGDEARGQVVRSRFIPYASPHCNCNTSAASCAVQSRLRSHRRMDMIHPMSSTHTDKLSRESGEVRLTETEVCLRLSKCPPSPPNQSPTPISPSFLHVPQNILCQLHPA